MRSMSSFAAMAPHTRTDGTVDPAEVAWADLVRLGRWQVAHELVISLPWLAGAFYAARAGHYAVALACSVMLVLTFRRPAWTQAARVTLWRPHRHCLAEDDVEAMGARLTAWGALMLGPRYPWLLHSKALEIAAPGERRWIAIELAANALWI